MRLKMAFASASKMLRVIVVDERISSKVLARENKQPWLKQMEHRTLAKTGWCPFGVTVNK